MELIRAAQGTAGDVSHRHQAVGFQLFSITPADAPEVGQRPVRPALPAVAHFIQFGDPCSIRIRLNMFGDDIHRDFG